MKTLIGMTAIAIALNRSAVFSAQAFNTTPVSTYGQPVTNTHPVNTYGQLVNNTKPVNTFGQIVTNTNPLNSFGQAVLGISSSSKFSALNISKISPVAIGALKIRVPMFEFEGQLSRKTVLHLFQQSMQDVVIVMSHKILSGWSRSCAKRSSG